MVLERQLVLRLLFLCLGVTLTRAQTTRNGQIFTNGLAIVDAPAIGTTLHANSDLNLAIDVSGNGKLEEAAWTPGSGRATSYDSLNVFLTSAERKVNFTVSTGPGLLTQEPGSTVKHFNWPIPTCISPGQYEVTLYENSRVNGTPYFSITALPLKIENANPSAQVCTSGLNDYQQGVQASSPPPTNPWIGGSPPSPNGSPGSTTLRFSSILSAVAIGLISITAGFSGQPDDHGYVPGGPTTQPTLPPSTMPPQPTSSDTSTGTEPLESVTVIVVSVKMIEFTTTVDGRPTVETSFSTSFRTSTTVLPDGPRGTDNSRFLPINKGKPKHSIPELLFTVVLWNIIIFAFAWVSL